MIKKKLSVAQACAEMSASVPKQKVLESNYLSPTTPTSSRPDSLTTATNLRLPDPLRLCHSPRTLLPPPLPCSLHSQTLSQHAPRSVSQDTQGQNRLSSRGISADAVLSGFPVRMDTHIHTHTHSLTQSHTYLHTLTHTHMHLLTHTHISSLMMIINMLDHNRLAVMSSMMLL